MSEQQKKIPPRKPEKSTLPEELAKFELAMRQAKRAERQSKLFDLETENTAGVRKKGNQHE